MNAREQSETEKQKILEAVAQDKGDTVIGILNTKDNTLVYLGSLIDLNNYKQSQQHPQSQTTSRTLLLKDVRKNTNVKDWVAFSAKYSQENSRWEVELIPGAMSTLGDILEEDSVATKSHLETLFCRWHSVGKKDSEQFSILTVTNEEKQPENLEWEKILNTTIVKKTLLPLPEGDFYPEQDFIYIKVVQEDASKKLSYTAINAENKVTENKIAWTNLPKTAAEICKDPSALFALTTLIKSRPEQELQSLFNQAYIALYDDFTIQKRNELFLKFNKEVLIHRGWFQYGIINTASYQRVVGKIRKNALIQLDVQIDEIITKYAKKTFEPQNQDEKLAHDVKMNNEIHALLIEAKGLKIFNEHRCNFRLTGAWGRTAAVSKIDSLLDKYPLKEAHRILKATI